jgi:hypothetical protein
LDNGTAQSLGSNGRGQILDDALGIQYGGAVPIGDPAAQSISRNDTPGVPVAGTTHVVADYSFVLYLMYKPDGGVWVTLRTLTWSWDNSATWDPRARHWAVDGAPNYHVGAVVDTSVLPQWKDYFTHYANAWVNN